MLLAPLCPSPLSPFSVCAEGLARFRLIEHLAKVDKLIHPPGGKVLPPDCCCSASSRFFHSICKVNYVVFAGNCVFGASFFYIAPRGRGAPPSPSPFSPSPSPILRHCPEGARASRLGLGKGRKGKGRGTTLFSTKCCWRRCVLPPFPLFLCVPKA